MNNHDTYFTTEKEFEEWILSMNPAIKIYLDKYKNGDYINPAMQLHWETVSKSKENS